MSKNNAAAKARGEQLRRERAGRIARIRRAVVATSLASFAIAWGVIAGAGSQGVRTATTASARAATSTRSDQVAATPSAVTTRQS